MASGWRPPSERDRAEHVYERDERTQSGYVMCRYMPTFPWLVVITAWLIIVTEVEDRWPGLGLMIVTAGVGRLMYTTMVSVHVKRQHSGYPVVRPGDRMH